MPETLWNPETELVLFLEIINHRPIGTASSNVKGVNRHFAVMTVAAALAAKSIFISPAQIWDKLHEMYDMEAIESASVLNALL